MSARRHYVYALMPAGAAPSITAPAVAAPGETVRTASLAGFTALISPIDTDEVLPQRRSLITHARVLEEALREAAVLPMRFGMIAADLAQLEAAVAAAEASIAAGLERLAGKAEFGLRVSWDRELILKELVAANPGLVRAWNVIRGKSEAASHFERVELGRQVEAALAAQREQEAERLDADFRARVLDAVRHTPDEDMQVLKADYLAPLDAENALFDAARGIEAEAPGRLAIKLVGPAPAYNFVDLKLTLPAPAQQAA